MEMKKGKVFSINCSKAKGTAKKALKRAELVENFGLKNDAHGGPGLRQVSLLAIEAIRKQSECPKAKSKNVTLAAGDFAENITTEGLNLAQLKIGNRLKINKGVTIEISKIGKECHRYCSIYYKLGDCIMPREGIFAKVLKGGEIAVGDGIEAASDEK
ncbi:MAG: MOSC domain-containing protein [Omnitrophica bacterium]|nr:MOSC domain-containing protein [Candidatus Omnitrophota bacterium]